VNEDKMLNKSSNQNNNNNKNKKIIEEKLYLLEEVVKEFQNSGEQEDELIQAGYIGLLNAINLYYKQGEEIFTHKAKYLIAGEIRHYIRQKHKKVKIPGWLKVINGLINKIMVSHHKKFNRFPSFKELSQMLNMSSEELTETLKARESVYKVSIDKDRRARDITESPDTIKIKKAIKRKGK
jgi:RNA polymerase sigma-B factor